MNSEFVFLPQKSSGEAYLHLQLDSQTQALLAMKQAREVLTIPAERLTPIPNMPESVLGLLNQRSRVFWAIDLPQLLELSSLEPHLQEYNLAIVHFDNIPLALAVQGIKGVTRIDSEAIRSPLGAVAAGLAPYLQGCVLKQEEMLLVLDVGAIVRASVWQGD